MLCEEEVAAEHKRQEQEAERRLQEMQQHVESLLKVIRKTQEASGVLYQGRRATREIRR